MPIYKVTVKQYGADNTLIESEVCFVEKKLFRQARLLSDFGIGYTPGDVFDFCPLKNHVKPGHHWFYKISVERVNFLSTGPNQNIVALADAPELLKILEGRTLYSLTNLQRQKALAIIAQVQTDSRATLLAIFEALLLIPELEQFALASKQAFVSD